MAADPLALAPTPPAGPPALAALRRNWGWLLAFGVVLIVAGTAAILYPVAATITTVEVFGVFLLVSGGAQLAGAFWARGWDGVLVAVLLGVLYLVAGVFLLERPILGAAGYTLFLAMFFLATGAIRIGVAVVHRFHGWGWAALGGAVSLILGLLIWRDFPEAAFWVIGTFVGIDLLFAGWAWVMLALAVKRVPAPAAA
ncbi:MAG: HdeD family acid-resistance protein [Gemmataceae bacterium]|nr:HdeD family acid-resistance protein [Gemmataceae bacterium]